MAGINRLIPPKLSLNNCISGYLPDDMVSFNIRRKGDPLSERPIILLPSSGHQRPIVPGVKNGPAERSLKQALQTTIYPWIEIKKHGFEISNYHYSFLWRFRQSHPFIWKNIRHPLKVEERSNKDIKRAFRDYRCHLRDKLVPGNIFMLPDAEIDFQNPSRYSNPYARRMLILDIYPDRLLIIPFSTNLSFFNRNVDILFDSSRNGRRLNLDAQPAIENFPYLFFPDRTFLCISCTQQVDTHDFLDAALKCICAVQKDILDAARQRLKKLSPIRFQ